jgi:hypothetical protein
MRHKNGITPQKRGITATPRGITADNGGIKIMGIGAFFPEVGEKMAKSGFFDRFLRRFCAGLGQRAHLILWIA